MRKTTWYWGKKVAIFDWEWGQNFAPRDGQKIPCRLTTFFSIQL